jgi:hypothetical protein
MILQNHSVFAVKDLLTVLVTNKERYGNKNIANYRKSASGVTSQKQEHIYR